MKIGIIGANGNLGKKITKEALNRGHQVTAFIYKGELELDCVKIEKNLFDMVNDDVKDLDVVISAFGGGISAKIDASINKKAFEKYIELLDNTSIKLIVTAGAGSLYTDETHTLYEYEANHHPEKLKETSKNIKLGVDELKKTTHLDWTAVCPSRQFDLNGPLTKKYLIGEKEEIIYNEDGKSYLTYEDMAQAMLDIAQERTYSKQVITIATATVK